MASRIKVLSNALAQFIGKILTVAASLVIVKITTGFGAEFYGNYLTAYEFLAFFGILADAGLFAIGVREMSKRPEKTEFVLSNIFSMRLLLIIGVTLLAGISAQFIPNYPEIVKTGIWITALSMALTIIAGTLSSVLQARMKIQYFSGSLVLGKILLAVLIFFISQNITLFPNVFFAMLWAGVLSNFIFCLLVLFFATREVPLRLGFDLSWWREIFRVSLPYGMALILQTLYLRIDILLISIILGASAVGIYGVSTRILESFLILGVFFGQAILPRLSAEEGNQKKAEKTLSWGIEMLLIFSLPIILGTIVFAPEIIQLISSEEFLSRPGFFGSDKVLIFLVITVFFAYFNQLFTFTLVAKNRQKYLLFVNGIALLLNTGLNITFLTQFGIIAAALSTIACEMIVFFLLMRAIFSSYRPTFSGKNLGVIALANVLLFCLIYLTPLKGNLILAAALGGLIYFGFLMVFRKQFLPQESEIL
ncbi:oligosaccharide flippase family protein [Candidatus Gracilibacteria bacterium]|nr:oligosaccharide flippase family protein [Candidatus Gracilibacteria bacterium]